MLGLHRLLELWSWLPAFRFVAETEHLPSASDLLYTSPSALSRTVKQLEQALGLELFDRVGRGLVLNEAGRQLLGGVRRAMRYVDDVVQDLQGEELRGELQVASTTQLGTAWLLESVPSLREAHPELVLSLVPSPGPLVQSLLQGRIDLALVEQPQRHAELTLTQLGRGGSSVYCGQNHPLWKRAARRGKALSEAALAKHEFVAPPEVGGKALDDWPATRARRVGLRVDQVRVALQACLDGGFLAVLPDDVARPAVERDELRALRGVEIPSAAVYALTRHALHPRDAAQVAVEAIRARRAERA